jgi:glucosamine-6-phosphate deaminase
MAAELRAFATADELGAALAEEILDAYDGDDGSFLLGCPGGRSLRSTYAALARSGRALDRLVVLMMDEYVRDGVAVPADAHYSCRGFAEREIAGPLGLRAEQVWLPDPASPERYDERIAAAGGIDLFLLASGASDGHVAFLAPGASRAGRTAVVPLATSTRRDNLRTFPRFRSLDEVPLHGVSVGLATIADSRAARLVLVGPEKRTAAARLLALDRFDPAWPASIVHECHDAQIWADRAALEEEEAA